MIVSWDWLKDYVKLEIAPDEFERRLMMAGLNHESSEPVDGDLAIDLEVTSNRPDCLGHIGIAREAAVLFKRSIKLPAASPQEGRSHVSDLAKVSIQCPALCPCYTARVIRGARVGASPDWMIRRLKTIGVTPINNIVDITNYVLFECGQPLHAFDFGKLAGGEIIVREPTPGERIEAIDHKMYELASGTCVIADARRAVAIGGVMGGAETEVTDRTTALLIEAAIFDPSNIRATARRLGLHSDSSYRFERGVDPAGVDWASRRCCELILEHAGGELAAGVIRVGEPLVRRQPITLRFSQLKRILGIELPAQRAIEILTALGNELVKSSVQTVEVIPPTWRRDLAREIDLVEEVARIHGYESIPEDVHVPMAPSARSTFDRVLSGVRHAMTAAGFDEAYTLSAVDEQWSDAFSPWSEIPALQNATPVLRRADRLRRSLIPSLLGARRTNESLSNPAIELFEIAKIYLPQAGALPREDWMIGFTTGGEFRQAKGVIEALLAELRIADDLHMERFEHPLLERGRAARLTLGDDLLGLLGEVSQAGKKQFDLRALTAVAELQIDVLLRRARLVPHYHRLVPYPAVDRDINLVVSEKTNWADIAATVRQAAGPVLEQLVYRDTYRNPQRIGQGKKSVLFAITLRDPDGTLTDEEADRVRDQIVAACRQQFGGELRE